MLNLSLENMELFRIATRKLIRDDVLAIIFFGSRVIGKYRKDSDVDVLIVIKRGEIGISQRRDYPSLKRRGLG